LTIARVYVAYDVSLDGTAEANTTTLATDDESAVKEARQYG
jgi:hypothetical protein